MNEEHETTAQSGAQATVGGTYTTQEETPVEQRPPSRQVLRRAARVEKKKAIQHHNEEVRRCNKPKVDPNFPGTRAERRKYMSNRAPDAFVKMIRERLKLMAEMRAGVLGGA